MTFRLRDTLTAIVIAALILAWEALVLWLAIAYPFYFYTSLAVIVPVAYVLVRRWMRR